MIHPKAGYQGKSKQSMRSDVHALCWYNSITKAIHNGIAAPRPMGREINLIRLLQLKCGERLLVQSNAL